MVDPIQEQSQKIKIMKNYTLDISKRIKKHLERQGAKVILLRKMIQTLRCIKESFEQID